MVTDPSALQVKGVVLKVIPKAVAGSLTVIVLVSVQLVVSSVTTMV